MALLILSLLTIPYCLPELVLRCLPFWDLLSKDRRKKLLTAHVLLLLLNSFLFYGAGLLFDVNALLGKIFTLFYALLSSMLNLHFIPGHAREHIFTLGLTLTFSYTITCIAVFATYHLFGLDNITDYCFSVLLHCIFSLLFFPFLRFLMRSTVRPFLFVDSESYWSMLWFIPLSVSISSYFSAPLQANLTTIGPLISQIFLNLASILLCYCVARDYRDLLDRQTLLEQLSVQKEYYAKLSDHFINAQKIRHDFKHHISAIRSYADAGDSAAIVQYCDRLLEQHAASPSFNQTGCPAFDGILYRFASMSAENNIDFAFTGNFRMPALSDIDLSVLFGNAITNAFAGCMTIPDNRYIHITCRIEQEELVVRIVNSFDGLVREHGNVYLSRKRTDQPGFGIATMETICKNNQAGMQVRYDQKEFSVLFMLPLQQNF